MHPSSRGTSLTPRLPPVPARRLHYGAVDAGAPDGTNAVGASAASAASAASSATAVAPVTSPARGLGSPLSGDSPNRTTRVVRVVRIARMTGASPDRPVPPDLLFAPATLARLRDPRDWTSTVFGEVCRHGRRMLAVRVLEALSAQLHAARAPAEAWQALAAALYATTARDAGTHAKVFQHLIQAWLLDARHYQPVRASGLIRQLLAPVAASEPNLAQRTALLWMQIERAAAGLQPRVHPDHLARLFDAVGQRASHALEQAERPRLLVRAACAWLLEGGRHVAPIALALRACCAPRVNPAPLSLLVALLPGHAGPEQLTCFWQDAHKRLAEESFLGLATDMLCQPQSVAQRLLSLATFETVIAQNPELPRSERSRLCAALFLALNGWGREQGAPDQDCLPLLFRHLNAADTAMVLLDAEPEVSPATAEMLVGGRAEAVLQFAKILDHLASRPAAADPRHLSTVVRRLTRVAWLEHGVEHLARIIQRLVLEEDPARFASLTEAVIGGLPLRSGRLLRAWNAARLIAARQLPPAAKSVLTDMEKYVKEVAQARAAARTDGAARAAPMRKPARPERSTPVFEPLTRPGREPPGAGASGPTAPDQTS